MWSVMKEKSSSGDLPTALITSRDPEKKNDKREISVNMVLHLNVWMLSFTHFAVMKYVTLPYITLI